MAVLRTDYVRISHARFLDCFWPVPPTDSASFKEQTRSSRAFKLKLKHITETSRGKTPTDLLIRYVREHKLAEGFKFSLQASEGSPDASDTGNWAQLVREGDAKPEWAKPAVLFKFCDTDPFRELDQVRRGDYHSYPYYGEDDDYDGQKESLITLRDNIAATVQRYFVDQHLTAVFVVMLYDSTVRLSRWDRDGVLFSKRIDYIKNLDVLPDVFRRLSMLTDEQLGCDPTVTPVLPGTADYNLMETLSAARPDDFPLEEGTVVEGDTEDASRVFACFREAFADGLSKSKSGARWRLSIPVGGDGASHDFLVGSPFMYEYGADSDCRNGRAYIAVDCETGCFVFLKDAWRIAADDGVRPREGQVLAHLNQAGVPHVPTLVCEADLQASKTCTFVQPRDPSDDDEVDSDGDTDYDAVYAVDHTGYNTQPQKHYRIATRELCVTLHLSFETGPQLLSTLKDCLIAHAEAVKAGYIHGDISYSNLMIYPSIHRDFGTSTVRWQGMLIDWELNRPAKPNRYRLSNYSRRRHRTWISASSAYCANTMKEIDVADELESFLWSILFIAVRFLRTNFSPKDVDGFIERFCKYTLSPRHCACHMSVLKQQALLRGQFDNAYRYVFKGHDAQGDLVDTPMNAFFDEYLHLCHAAYVPRMCGPTWKIYPRPQPRENETREDAGMDKIEARELAKKLDDHSAVLELIDRTLRMDWPRDEHAGDQWMMSKRAEKEKKEKEEKERQEKEEKEKDDVAAAEDGAKENDMGGRGREKRVRKAAAKNNSRRAVPKRNKRPAAGSKSRTLVASRKINHPAQKEPPPQQEDDNPLKRRRNPVRSTRQTVQDQPPEEPPTKRRRRC
ncbi:hypothetical protein C8Q74DRAFT_12784 [Fomes fomentarius]|nr:hypothetical protein C8Q74DRAFT_12784 [Fomes fomentarius]